MEAEGSSQHEAHVESCTAMPSAEHSRQWLVVTTALAAAMARALWPPQDVIPGQHWSGAEPLHDVQLESLFWAMTGETEESFRQGRMVEAQVIYVGTAPGSSVRWEKTLQKPRNLEICRGTSVVSRGWSRR